MGTSSIIAHALQTIDPEIWWLSTESAPSMVAEQELHTVAEQDPQAIMVYGTPCMCAVLQHHQHSQGGLMWRLTCLLLQPGTRFHCQPSRDSS